MLTNIWGYRQFIYSSVKREFLSRYKGSILGVTWSIVQPLAMIIVYTLIFSEVMKTKLAGMSGDSMAYSIYLCSGILTWGLFVEQLSRTINVFQDNGNLLKKLSFPRICLPIIVICSSMINFIIGWLLFLVVLLIIGRFPWSTFCFFVPVLIVQIFLASSLGIGLGVLNVFFRDVGQMVNVVLQFWFWFTPVVYPAVIIPEKLKWLENVNPMYHILGGYQNIFVYGKMPDFFAIMMVFLLGVLTAVWSLYMYRKHVGEMVDEL